MNTVQRIAKNTAVLLAATIISKVLSFLYVMYAARYLGAEGFGILSFALAFTGIFGVFSDLGLDSLTIREVARDKSLAKKYLNNISVMKAILVTITFALIAILINLLGYPEQTTKVVYLVALSIIFSAFSNMFNSIFQAYEKMEYQSVGHILSSALLLLGALFAISQDFSVVGFAAVYFLVSVIGLGYTFAVSAWKFVLPKIEVDWSFWKPTIKEALPFGLSGIFVNIYFWIDTVMLSLMVPNANEVIGWYNAAYRLVLVLLFIPSVYFSSVFPVMSRLFKTSEESLKFVFERSFRYMAIIAVPIGVGTTLLADKIIPLIFGLNFTPATIALQILVWSTVLIFINSAFSHLFYSINKQTIITKVRAIIAIINVILNFLLIPRYSYIGASIATLVSDLVTLLVMISILSSTEYRLSMSSIKDVSKVLISSIAVFVFIKYSNNINLFLIVIISVFIYFVVLFIMKGLDKEDMLIAKNLLTKKPMSKIKIGGYHGCK